MEYTHYFKMNSNIADEVWSAYIDFVTKVIDRVNNRKMINSADGNEEQLIRIFGASGYGLPTINSECVAFNGDAAEGFNCETFFADRKNECNSNFCKTNRNPYDIIVVACLAKGAELGVLASWSSDGGKEDHKSGMDLKQSLESKKFKVIVTKTETYYEFVECEALDEYAAARKIKEKASTICFTNCEKKIEYDVLDVKKL